MKFSIKQYIFIIPIFLNTCLFAQPVGGDIAFLGFNSDNPDQFTIIITNYLDDGTVLYFTDAGWTGSAFYAFEGHIKWTVPTGGVAGGTMVTFTGGAAGAFTAFGTGALEPAAAVSLGNLAATASTSQMAFSTNGDAIIAYIGSIAAPTCIACVNFNGAWTFAGANLAEQSLLPPGLTNGVTCVLLPDRDNQVIDCDLLPQPAVASDYNTAAYWVYNDATRYVLPPTIGLCDLVLPIIIKSFYAIEKSNATILNWITASEINALEFNLEKSDGISDFYSIATIQAEGNSISEQYYTYLDDANFSGTDYYRLKLIDTDLSFVYSDIIAVNKQDQMNSNTAIIIYPNPVDDMLHFTIQGNFEPEEITIISIDGTQITNVILDENIIEAHHLSAGIYIMQIRTKQHHILNATFIKK